MTTPHPVTDRPFHAGEAEVQTRLGVHERSSMMMRRMVRPYLPDQHRQFFADLTFLFLGSVDPMGRVWASVVSGPPGFVSSPDDRTLSVAAPPVDGDPLAEALAAGGDIGVLGLMPAARRRNRATGRIRDVRPLGFDIDILQSFGNCPQYIQARHVTPRAHAQGDTTTTIADRFDQAAIDQISGADALFVASAYRDSAAASEGADMSHRGGKPGFVKVLDDRSFIFPDFRGNNAYNTLGNIVKNPNSGYLFVDFDTGDLLTMTGKSTVIWDGPEVDAFEGAQRLVRFEMDELRRIEGGFPHRSTFQDYAPQLARTGDWGA